LENTGQKTNQKQALQKPGEKHTRKSKQHKTQQMNNGSVASYDTRGSEVIHFVYRGPDLADVTEKRGVTLHAFAEETQLGPPIPALSS